MRLFSNEWFERYQLPLLFLANTRGGRKVLRVYDDVPRDRSIIAVRPNGVTWLEERHPTFLHALWSMRQERERSFTADFRTHDKIRKRLVYGVLPAWERWSGYVNQVWRPFAVQPAFALTLTVYPDPDVEVTTVDGEVLRASTESWATLIAGAGTSASDAGSTSNLINIQGGASNWGALRRSIFLFLTSGLTASAVISDAVYSIYGSSKIDNLSITPDVNVYSSAPASNTALVAGDFTTLGSTAFSTAIGYNAFSNTNYNDFTLNASGVLNISKTSVSKFGCRNANYDVAAVEPALSNALSRIITVFADQVGTSSDPKLVVTYTLPGGPAMLMGMI